MSSKDTGREDSILDKIPDMPEGTGISMALVPTIKESLGLDTDELASVRIAAVEDFLITKKRELMCQLEIVDKKISNITKERSKVINNFMILETTKREHKIQSGLIKINISKVYPKDIVSQYHQHEKENDSQDKDHNFRYDIVTTLKDRLIIDIRTVTLPQKISSKCIALFTELDKAEEEKSILERRAYKCDEHLANLDSEERRAKAIVASAKIKKMKNGMEFLKEMVGNMPQI